ncbi:MAG: nucleoside hydrolase [Pontiellaceae bacterium]|nr:nucleoside hydrolase [Pontiellaceae bacterium]MBN2783476.1 nucleoside hydrolase [Pontiellaceae bacterium]
MIKPNIIFDTDMGNDVDDALAQVLLHAFGRDGFADFAVALVNKGARLAPAFVDLINRAYGRDDIEVGWCADSPTPSEGVFLRPVLEVGAEELPYDPDHKNWPDAVSLLRRRLTEIPDGSGVYVSIGFCTILARFLESGPDEISPLDGVQLARRKIGFASLMAGNFDPEVLANPTPENVEHNIVNDIPSAKRALELCPVPMVFSGFEVGSACCYPHESVTGEMDHGGFNPLRMAYDLYCGLEHDRPLWDLTSLLYAVFPDADWFDVSEPGVVGVTARGHTTFRPHPAGRHHYLILKKDRMDEMISLFRDGCSRPCSFPALAGQETNS